jgi:hypothetical protein
VASWDRPFAEPIELPGGKKVITLRDAAHYITKLPKAEHDADEWQAAMQALLLVVEHDGRTMFAHRYHEGVEPPRRPRVRPIAERQASGTPEAGAGPVTKALAQTLLPEPVPSSFMRCMIS